MSEPEGTSRRAERGRRGGRSLRSTRIRAALAGALVLGVGTAATLAAWSDDEFGTGTFAASTFAVESQTAATPWAGHESGNPAVLAFNATAMSPLASQYAYIDIRTTSATNIGGSVALTSVAEVTGTLITHLEYRVVTITTATPCAAGAFASASVPAYTSSLAVGSAPPAVSGVLAAAGASPVRFCFDVRVKSATPTTAQGTTATAKWQFTATSSS